ncbi:MAG TPA: 4-alpha-glucanotransferase [Tepidisphaeraceae bacterium]|jgi:4-alpha-glucanotransferase
MDRASVFPPRRLQQDRYSRSAPAANEQGGGSNGMSKNSNGKTTSRTTRRGDARVERRFTFSRRASGVLMHLTSLPGPHGSGDLGSGAYAFANFLHDAGQRWWQMLPVSPPSAPGYSPYSSYSAFAGSPWFVSLELLAKDLLLDRADLRAPAGFRADSVLYPEVNAFRDAKLRKAFARFRSQPQRWGEELAGFREKSGAWLDDFVLFSALKKHFDNKPWIEWPKDVRFREEKAIARVRQELAEEIAFHEFVQFQFDRQWMALKKYCNDRDIGLIGDIPIFVDHDSCDVWAHPELFELEKSGKASAVTGCPPDAFNADGQFWRHPHYDWAYHRKTGFAWWIARFALTMRMFDAVRIDHFLGMHRLWSIPPQHKTARNGKWISGPGAPLFEALKRELGDLPIIAEDLGAVTKEALDLRDQFKFPGMHVLQFGFGGDNSHLPHTYERRRAVYTGTHDNHTAVGWFKNAPPHERKNCLDYIDGTPSNIAWQMIRALETSVADTVIIQTQDLIGAGESARMNSPGTTENNWRWRLKPGALTRDLAKRLRRLAELTGRLS